jgi:hypothetical protein
LACAIAIAGVVLVGCPNPSGSNDQQGDPSNPDDQQPEQGVRSSQLEVNEGSVGLLVDVRPIVLRGYQPTAVQLEFADYPSFSQTLDVDADTSLATFKVGVETLSQAEVDDLADGTDLTVTVRDSSGTELAQKTNSIPINSSSQPLSMTTTLPKLYPQFGIMPGVPYHIQVIRDGHTADGQLFRVISLPDASNDGDVELDGNFDINNSDQFDEYSFYFESTGVDDVYFITVTVDGNGPYYLYNGVSNLRVTDTAPDSANPEEQYRFGITRDENGLLKVEVMLDNASDGFLDAYEFDSRIVEGSDYLPLRAFAANIDWDVQDFGPRFADPIIPPAKLDFAYRVVLENCSSATLTETVGALRSETRTTTVGTEESFELFSSSEQSTSVSTSLEIGGAFKAISASASVEVTNSFSYTTSTTQTSTNTWQETDSFTDEVSFERQVDLQPFTAVEAYDSLARFENVKMPFVQRLRVRGSYNGAITLTGDEIVSQLMANQFGGVVTTVGPDYVDISIRGTAEIANYFEAFRAVVEIPEACSGA